MAKHTLVVEFDGDGPAYAASDTILGGRLVAVDFSGDRLAVAEELLDALRSAQEAINSMKVEAETAAQGDEQMMLDACEAISNEGLQADMAIRAVIHKATAQ